MGQAGKSSTMKQAGISLTGSPSTGLARVGLYTAMCVHVFGGLDKVSCLFSHRRGKEIALPALSSWLALCFEGNLATDSAMDSTLCPPCVRTYASTRIGRSRR